MLIIAIILLGMIAGFLARWILANVTGADFSLTEAFVAGLAGSFVGGLLLSLLAGDGFTISASGILGSTVGAVVILAVWGIVRGRQSTGAGQ
ncbi:MAG: GlsB/YeaQ/YmgE family stress response membrane protein [Jiangellales bacterium]